MAQEEPKLNNEEQSFGAAQDELKALQLKCEEYLNGWKRERADFLNYKKDEMERISELAKYANTEIILKIIPILDNIYLAESHIPAELEMESPPSHKASEGQTSQAWKVWIEGFNQIKNQLVEFLKKEGIEPVETIGKQFDPNFHEVVAEISPSEALAKGGKPGTIIEEVQRGYTMHGKIIRVAKVKISK
jgi:molecular chaperone GrpE